MRSERLNSIPVQMHGVILSGSLALLVTLNCLISAFLVFFLNATDIYYKVNRTAMGSYFDSALYGGACHSTRCDAAGVLYFSSPFSLGMYDFWNFGLCFLYVILLPELPCHISNFYLVCNRSRIILRIAAGFAGLAIVSHGLLALVGIVDAIASKTYGCKLHINIDIPRRHLY